VTHINKESSRRHSPDPLRDTTGRDQADLRTELVNVITGLQAE
jgi:hypothetical protein